MASAGSTLTKRRPMNLAWGKDAPSAGETDVHASTNNTPTHKSVSREAVEMRGGPYRDRAGLLCSSTQAGLHTA